MTNSALRVLALGTTLSCGWLLSACGSSGGVSGTDSGPDVLGHTDAGHDTGKSPEASKPESGKPESGTKDTGAGDSGPDKTPITGLTMGTWTWVPFPTSICRDGSPTGLGVNLGTSNNVMIFIEGGNACFNAITCGVTPFEFNETDFNKRVASTADETSISVGILDRTMAANPVKDWSFVYVPYCTGDLVAGQAEATIPGVTGTQHFAGYADMGLFLARIVPTFSTAKQVLLAGMSAGGFAAGANYAQVARAFGATPVTLLDDSGPFMQDPYLAACFQNEIRKLWGLDSTILVDCGTDCSNPASFFLDLVEHSVKKYPNVNFGLADSTDDAVITAFFGYGDNNCMGVTQETAAMFTAGLQDIRTQLSSQSNYGEFIFTGIDHTTTQSAAFYTRTAGGTPDGGADAGPGVKMTDWVTGLISGKPTNPGP